MSKDSKKKLQKETLKTFLGPLLPPESCAAIDVIDDSSSKKQWKLAKAGITLAFPPAGAAIASVELLANVALDAMLNKACGHPSDNEFDRMSPSEKSVYFSNCATRAESYADSYEREGNFKKAQNARNIARQAREEAKAWRDISNRKK